MTSWRTWRVLVWVLTKFVSLFPSPVAIVVSAWWMSSGARITRGWPSRERIAAPPKNNSFRGTSRDHASENPRKKCYAKEIPSYPPATGASSSNK